MISRFVAWFTVIGDPANLQVTNLMNQSSSKTNQVKYILFKLFPHTLFPFD